MPWLAAEVTPEESSAGPWRMSQDARGAQTLVALSSRTSAASTTAADMSTSPAVAAEADHSSGIVACWEQAPPAGRGHPCTVVVGSCWNNQSRRTVVRVIANAGDRLSVEMGSGSRRACCY